MERRSRNCEWVLPLPTDDHLSASRAWRVSPLIARLLINRGVTGADDGATFLCPRLGDLYPPETLPGVERASELLRQAVDHRHPIVLYGDYDVDGTTGVSILWHVLRLAGAEVSWYVPHRVEEGYGINSTALGQLLSDGARVVVSVDCGITALDAVEQIHRSGGKLIITDHHAPGARIPEADAVVHPYVGGTYANPDLCGSGVAFKLAWGFAQRMSGQSKVSPEFRGLLSDLLPLAALGTIADVVPLRGENRIIARNGLRGITHSPIPGLRCLLECSGLNGNSITGYDAGFKLAPRINAAGRMGHARLAIELLTRADTARAREIALYLEDHNRSRQSVERKIRRQVEEMIDGGGLAGDARRAIVLGREGWHPGVIGIVAARLVERYHRPTVLIALKGEDGQGSGRGVPHFHMADALKACGAHLLSHGGHAMAAGLRIKTDCVQDFTEAFVQHANRTLTGEDLVPKLRLDAEVALRELDLETAEAIADLGPFGVGNPRPRLATDWVELNGEPRCVGRGDEHLQASFLDRGTTMRAIGFGLAGHIEELKHRRRCRVAFEPVVNEFNGRRSVEMQMIDLRYPDRDGKPDRT